MSELSAADQAAYDHARNNDPTLHCMLKMGASLEQIIIMLCSEKKKLGEQAITLDAIRPRRYELPDGRVVVWQCPHHLIPLEKLGTPR